MQIEGEQQSPSIFRVVDGTALNTGGALSGRRPNLLGTSKAVGDKSEVLITAPDLLIYPVWIVGLKLT